MAEVIVGDHDQYICSVCLDLLKDPVTIPCGHSYCMSCINECWNSDVQKGAYKCPQCRQTFNSKPPLNRSTVLAEIMETLRGKETAQSLAGPGDIACDFCAGKRIKAVKSCLECRASYCETHVQPHYNVPPLRKHKLVKAAIIPICSKHDKLLEVYCRTDQTCVCTHCLMDDHKNHDIVPSTVERKEKQVELTDTKEKVKQKIQAKEKELQKMKTDITSHSDSAKKTVENSTKIFTELVKLVEKRSNEVIEKIKAQGKADLDQGEKLQEKLKGEITELKKREGDLETVIQTDDNIQFLQNYESLSSSSGSDGFPRHSFKAYCSHADVNKLVCELKERMETIFDQVIDETLQKVSDLTTKNNSGCIKVGDRVRVKPSVKTPTYDWGKNFTHKTVGVVKDINSDMSLVISFPGYPHWKGILSEVEQVTDDDEYELIERIFESTHTCFKIGNLVSVRTSVKDPKHGWGSVTHNSIGVIKKIQGDFLTVDFPEQTDWTGVVSEMELKNGDVSELHFLSPGVKVHVKPTICTPAHGWGSVTKQSIGVIIAIDGTKVTVNFPEQCNWTGVISEMEAVP